jgi:hypothetical protein
VLGISTLRSLIGELDEEEDAREPNLFPSPDESFPELEPKLEPELEGLSELGGVFSIICSSLSQHVKSIRLYFIMASF